MSSKRRIAAVAACVLLALVAVVVWRCAPPFRGAAEPVAAAELPRTEVAELPAMPATASAAESDRSEVGAAEHGAPPPRALPPYEFALEFSVTDADDAPLAGASVFLAPARHPIDRAGETDAEGRLVVRWRGFVSSMDVVVAASSDSMPPGDLRLVRVLAGSDQRVAMRALSGGMPITIRRVYISSLAKGAVTLETTPEPERMLARDDGFADFVDPWIAHAIEEKEAGAALELGSALEQAIRFDLVVRLSDIHVNDIDLRVALGSLRLPASEVEVVPFELQGTVFGADEQPAPGVLVRVRREGESNWSTTRTDGDGHYDFASLTVATYEFAAGDGSNGTFRGSVTGLPGASVPLDARLERGRELRGRLISRDGQALVAWSIEIVRDDALGPWIDGAQTDGEGEFRIPSLPSGGFTMLARPSGAPAGAVPLLVARNAWPTLDIQEFTVPVDAFGGLRVEVVDEHDEPVGDAEVRLWRIDSQRGQRLAGDNTGAVFASEGVFPGAYWLEVGAPARGWTVLEHLFVVPGETLDLGRFRMPASARVEIAAGVAAKGEPWRCVLLHRGAEVESLSSGIEREPPFALAVAAGEYQRAASVAELSRAEPLELKPGDTQRIEREHRGPND